jgi:hypothetical protein
MSSPVNLPSQSNHNYHHDISSNVSYVSNIPFPIHIVSDLSNVTIVGNGYTISNNSGFAEDGSFVINNTFASTNPSNNDPIINEILT